MTRTPRIAFLLLAVGLGLTGCSAAGADADGSSSATTDLGPIETYLASAKKEWRDANRAAFPARQDAIAECMAAAGFTYLPQTLPAATPPADRTDAEWVAQHGYGHSPESSEKLAHESYADSPEGIDTAEQTAYVESLSDAESDAYYAALMGPLDETGELGAGYGGCLADLPPDPRFTPAALKVVREGTLPLRERADSDPRVVEADEAWASCMVEAGYEGLSRPQDADEQAFELYHPVDDRAAEMESAEDGPSLTEEQLAAARRTEIATALADLDCQEDVDHRNITTEVLHELESAWVEDNSAVLDEVIAGYRAGS